MSETLNKISRSDSGLNIMSDGGSLTFLDLVKIPGKVCTFACGHAHLIPEAGQSNQYVYWTKNKKARLGGGWRCKACTDERGLRVTRGTGPSGLLGKMKYLLIQGRKAAKKFGFTPPTAPAESVLSRYI